MTTPPLQSRDALIRARKQKKLTQEQLANAVGITRAYLANIERGQHAPSLKIAFEIAKVLGGTVEELFSTRNDVEHDLANDPQVIAHIKASREDRKQGRIYSGEDALNELRRLSSNSKDLP